MIWPNEDGIAKTRAAAATASVARSRSGASERIMRQHRIGDDRNGGDLQAVQPAAAERVAEPT